MLGAVSGEGLLYSRNAGSFYVRRRGGRPECNTAFPVVGVETILKEVYQGDLGHTEPAVDSSHVLRCLATPPPRSQLRTNELLQQRHLSTQYPPSSAAYSSEPRLGADGEG